jgi:hypothetical protein
LRAIQARPETPPEPGDPSWLACFLASLAREDLSPATLRGYRYDLRHFLRWHRGITEMLFAPDRLAEYDLIAYRQHMIAGWKRSAASGDGRITRGFSPPMWSATFGPCARCATAGRPG